MMREVMSSESVGAGANYTSIPTILRDGMNVHCLEYQISGDGTVAITPQLAISGSAWISAGKCAKGLVKTSGPGADGKGFIDLILRPAEMIRFYVEETGSSDSAVVSLFFVQK